MTRNITINELCDTIRRCKDKKVVLTFHSIGDRDSVGSAVALSEYFTDATIATPDFITNNAKKMLAYVKFSRHIETLFPEGEEAVIILDANNLEALGKFKEHVKDFSGDVLFIDHHMPHHEIGINALMFNSETYNSTSSIVFDALRILGADITKNMAALLLNGIIADSADLNNSSPQTFRQIADLLEIANISFSFVSEYFHASVPVNNRYEIIKDVSSSRAEVAGNYVIIYGKATAHANIAADAAINLGADAAVFWTVTEREASVSARLRSPLDKELEIHLGLILESIAKIVDGNGGGHACAAGAYGPKREAAASAGDEAVRKIKEKMQIHLDKTKHAKGGLK